jgi:hypothetical protein
VRLRRWLTGAYERDDLATVYDEYAGDDVTIDGLDGHRWIRTDCVGHGLEKLLELQRNAGPGEVKERDQRVAESDAQRLLGHTASATTLMMAPAMAAAKPLRRASWASTLAKNDGDSGFDSMDMAMPFCA